MKLFHLLFVLVFFFNQRNKLAAATGCSASDPNRNCSGRIQCPSCLMVSWVSREPYVFMVNDSVKGLLPEILKFGVNKCCGIQTPSCWRISHNPPVNATEVTLLDSANAQFVYPVIVDSKTDIRARHNVIGLLPSTGIAFVARKGESKSLPLKLLNVVFDAWPVLIVMFLLAILAGILIWAMDTRTNPEHFPPSFFKGTWEGFWWAFVSMTTVGYGDRAPQSLIGRVFAVMWILLGICIISIFTATLTTSLTTISLDTTKSLQGARVAVLKDSIEAVVGVKQQAKIAFYDSVKAITVALEKEEVEGALLDTYLITHNKDLFPHDKYKVHTVVKEDSLSYGAVVNDEALASCLSYLLARDKYSVYEVIQKHMKDPLKGNSHESVKKSQSLFDPTGDLFYPSLWTCLTLVIIIVIVGALFEYLHRKRIIRKFTLFKQQDDKKSEIPMSNRQIEGIQNGKYCALKSPENLDQLEQQMLEEVRELFKAWRSRLKTNGGRTESEISIA